MLLEIIATLLLGGLFFRWGMRVGTLMLRKGATANDLFKGKTSLSLLFLGFYIGLILLALNVPQMQFLPIDWRVYGMRITWTIMRAVLLGFCGLAYIVSWQTARVQVVAVVLIGVLGVTGFSGAEAYFLAPIYASLYNNLQPNGVYKQTSMSSCAPAALATVLRRWQLEATEAGVARLAGTSRLGTSMPQLIVAAHELGLDGMELSPTWEQMQRINRPGVLGVWLLDSGHKLPHAVALLAMDNEHVAIGDPARGKIYTLNQAQFAEIWRQQYVPIFRGSDRTLTTEQATDYLQRLGYLRPPSQDLSRAIRRFQTAVGIAATGKLNTETVLLLAGPFLQGVPTLTPNQPPPQ
ncbi:hypothetical protein C7B82_24505 [Stenomitos frigidus ULC18]|uniref:Peptidase C39 domain-containing protein n=2 Tax=Stenomitos TaxID=1844270 RepID=A0A2T1DX45_9CYAN|nr:hypothetical protein C7B82_24505 [Stenomitos frigidus ULC18]